MPEQATRFEVHGYLPPKKDGASSMWLKDLEIQRVVKLRLAAVQAFGQTPPLTNNIGLRLSVHLPQNSRAAGDLDNFVTGVCDALQAAAPRTPWANHATWSDPRFAAIRPDQVIGMIDDCEVVEITAKKIVGHAGEPWYEVVLTGEVPGVVHGVPRDDSPRVQPARP